MFEVQSDGEMRLQLVPNDPKFRMHCPSCGVGQTNFLLGKTQVEVHSAASSMPLIALSDGTNQEFKKGHVEMITCAKCGTTYIPEDAHTTT